MPNRLAGAANTTPLRYASASSAGVGRDGLLRRVGDALDHAGRIDDRLQLDLAVGATDLIVAQRRRQRLGRRPRLLSGEPGVLDLLGHLTVLGRALLLNLGDLA